MSETVGRDDVVKMLLGAVKKIRADYETLSKLDSATGDGDHGTSMVRTAEAVAGTLEAQPDADLKTLLGAVGWAVMSIDGGSTGPLFGSFFMGLGEGVGDAEQLDPDALATMFEAGLAKVQKQTRAAVGDKTMMDALIPAVEAARAAADAGVHVPTLLQQAAEAAARGAQATADMQARHGRARNLGSRTLGHVDPGATSIAYIFEGFFHGISPEAQT